MEEVLWGQKSRALWLKEGEKNTKFFQSMANTRKRINLITKVRKGQGFIEIPEEVKEEVPRHFEELYTSESFLRPTLEGVCFPSSSSFEKSWLERQFEEEEISQALDACVGIKL
eukprot:TRINITY_DN19561_c4_g1_i1.p1 TRINITY_DN19561_c4_g1~~TRINITY_DN19561_c4_g1_i1.p1  ORF type:complete len:114 (-),score=25.20 TRINITY_DN19561_c4_g1_i1:9-350(-)